LERHALALIGGLGAALLIAFVFVAALFLRLEQTREDVQRVEAGALLATVQLQAFRDELVSLGPGVSDSLDEAITGLEAFQTSTLEFDVRIEEDVAIDTEIEIDREFTVPINTTLPIAQTIETTIEVQGPLGLAVPVDVTVPIDLEVPVVLDLTFAVQERIPIEAEVPVRFEVPIAVAIEDTGLADFGASLAAGLASFRELFASFAD
jgi:hypothetical protein